MVPYQTGQGADNFLYQVSQRLDIREYLSGKYQSQAHTVAVILRATGSILINKLACLLLIHLPCFFLIVVVATHFKIETSFFATFFACSNQLIENGFSSLFFFSLF